MSTKRTAMTSVPNIAVKKTKNWSLGLLDTMKDRNSIVKETERVVVIKDKYPKAKIHYLVLPREYIDSIFKLNKSHIGLLKEFGVMYKELNESLELELKAGFHAIPSMQCLHMHIISKDMISPCLKTKVHWNSFTTEFFRPYEDILQQLEAEGMIKKMPSEVHKNLMATPLKCNQCPYETKNMPQLKEHLLSHNKL